MNKLIEQINFKKVVIIYLILLTLTLSLMTIFLGNIYQDKLKTLYDYHKLTETLEKNKKENRVKEKINQFSKNKKDIIDIAIVKNDHITYTTSHFYQNELTSLYNTSRYYKDSNQNIYQLDTKKEFILDLFNIQKESNLDYYNEFQISANNDNHYILHYLKNDTNTEKIIIVSKINPIKNSHQYLKITLSILMLFFMLYLIIVALMIYQHAKKLKLNAQFWGIITLFTNFIGVVFYLIFIKNRRMCKKCHTNISIHDKYCKGCGEKL